MGSITGATFCNACMSTFKLLIGNPTQVAINAIIQKLLYTFQSLLIPLICAFACYESVQNNPLATSYSYPALVTLLISYVIARSFGSVYEATVNSLFVCSFKDEAEFDGKFMTPQLKDAFGKVAKQHAESKEEGSQPLKQAEEVPVD